MLSKWREILTIKQVNIPKDYSRGMDKKRGSHPRALVSLEEMLQKENIIFFTVALAAYAHEEEAP